MDDARRHQEATADVRQRHAEMMRLSRGTGRPEDYLHGLSFVLPFRAREDGLLVFCGCCQGPLHVRPKLGLWVSWQKDGGIAPLCAVCLEYLHRREEPGAGPPLIHVLPEYDPLGRGYCSELASKSPVELALARMAEIESRMPRDLSPGAHEVAEVARQAFLETEGTLRGLTNVWREQLPARMKIGRIMMALKAKGSPESLKEFDDIRRAVPGAMQAFVEAQAAGGGAGLQAN